MAPPDTVAEAHRAWSAALGERATHEYVCLACQPTLSLDRPAVLCTTGRRLADEEQAAFTAWVQARFGEVVL